MGDVILIASGKGGVGKTSVAGGVASCLAVMGRRVLAVDADVGLRSLDVVLGMTDRSSLDFGDVLLERVSLDAAAVVHPAFPSLYLLNAPMSITPEEVEPTRFAAMIEEAKTKFDYCIIDCPAGLGAMPRVAAAAADRGIIVATPDTISLRDAAHMASVLEDLGLTNLHIVLNRIRPKMVSRNDAVNLDDAMDMSGLPLLGAVQEDEMVISCSNHAKPLILHTYGGAADAFFNIAGRLTGRHIPLMKFKRSGAGGA